VNLKEREPRTVKVEMVGGGHTVNRTNNLFKIYVKYKFLIFPYLSNFLMAHLHLISNISQSNIQKRTQKQKY